jgi:hypothetical protein
MASGWRDRGWAGSDAVASGGRPDPTAPFSRPACGPCLPVGEHYGPQAGRLNGTGGNGRAIGSRLLGAAVALLAVAGCCNCPPAPPPAIGHVGPTESLDAVVQHIDANAAGVPSLWTQLDYAASFVDPHGKRTDASGDGTLLYRRPGSLVLEGNNDVAGPVFQLGCDGDQFWVKLRRSIDAGEYYWGHLANVGKPCCRPVPIRPDLLVQVLGVALLQTNFLEQPTPVMRFDNEHDAYVIDFNVRRPDRWVTAREVWYDREHCRPIRVVLYDDAGRAVVRAELSKHEPIKVDGLPEARWPVVARHYDLQFPDTGSTMTLDLDDPAVTHPARRRVLPDDGSFARVPPDEHDRVVQVDAACNGE